MVYLILVFTKSGSTCTFPFDYKGIIYNTCTSIGQWAPSCYDQNGVWTTCEGSHFELIFVF